MNNAFAFFLVFLAFSCTTKNFEGFEISANIENLPDGDIFLEKMMAGSWQKTDTVSSRNGKFEFKGSTEAPQMFRITLSDTLPSISVFVENSSISLNGNLHDISGIKVSGSVSHDIFLSYTESQKSLKHQLDSLSGKYDKAKLAGNAGQMQQIDSLFEQVSKARISATKSFISSHLSSPVAPYLAWTNLIYDSGVKELESLSASFDSTLKSSPYVILLNDYITTLKKLEPGNPAPEFTMDDPNGNPVHLSSLYGKYVFIDFWASWCSACRQENPNVVEAYKKFHSKGFDILGVSLDKNKESWLKAIRDDKLTWNHVSDLNRWKSEACRIFAIKRIPSNLLLDPKGTIIARNLTGEKLQNKLKEVLK